MIAVRLTRRRRRPGYRPATGRCVITMPTMAAPSGIHGVPTAPAQAMEHGPFLPSQASTSWSCDCNINDPAFDDRKRQRCCSACWVVHQRHPLKRVAPRPELGSSGPRGAKCCTFWATLVGCPGEYYADTASSTSTRLVAFRQVHRQRPARGLRQYPHRAFFGTSLTLLVTFTAAYALVLGQATFPAAASSPSASC